MGEELHAEIELTDVPQDSLVIMTPYSDDPKAFYYNQKINCLKASGYVSVGTHMHSFPHWIVWFFGLGQRRMDLREYLVLGFSLGNMERTSLWLQSWLWLR
jgi:hypothetical protein